MTSKRWSARLLAAFALTCLAPRLGAAGELVSIGQVTARAGKDRARLAAELRRVLREELAEINLRAPSAKERWVLSAALVELETRRTPQGSESTCVVSATLERAGALQAVVRGSARVQDAPVSEAEEALLRAAARGALRRLPEALR